MTLRKIRVLLLAAATAVALAACAADNDPHASTQDAAPPSVFAEFSRVEPTPTAMRPTRVPLWIPPPDASEYGDAAPPPHTTPAGVVCDLVPSNATRKTLPVAVLTGAVDCGVAVPVAYRYLNDTSLDIQGQQRFAIVDGWTCQWPSAEGRSHADSYLSCADPTGVNSIRIGD